MGVQVGAKFGLYLTGFTNDCKSSSIDYLQQINLGYSARFSSILYNHVDFYQKIKNFRLKSNETETMVSELNIQLELKLKELEGKAGFQNLTIG